ncbi:MAG: hypothetical protein AB7E76_00035 [Deferribacterales bacterium]
MLCDIKEWAYDSVFLYPLILSLLSAFIFWITFSVIPHYRKKRKIRVITDVKYMKIYHTLFHIFDLIMKLRTYSPSFYQHEIRAGQLTEEKIRMGLQNKCLSEKYLYDPNVSKSLIIIGPKIYEYTVTIEKITRNITEFNNYLSIREIQILEEILLELKTYNYTDLGFDDMSTHFEQGLYPVVSNMGSHSKMFFKLYLLTIELQKMVFRNKYTRNTLATTFVQYNFYKGNYSKTIRLAKKFSKKFPTHKYFYQLYWFQSLYKQGKKNKAYILLDKILSDNHTTKPVSHRSFLENSLNDQEILSILNKYYDKEDIDYMHKTIKDEQFAQEKFEELCDVIQKYFEDKLKKPHPVNPDIFKNLK